jgi:hypothetical protein
VRLWCLSTRACAAPMHFGLQEFLFCTWICLCCTCVFCLQEQCAAPVHVCLQKLMCCTCMGVSVFKSLCCTFAYLSTRAYVLHLHGLVCLQEPVLRLSVSVCKSFVLHLDVSIYKSLCSTCQSLSTRALSCT